MEFPSHEGKGCSSTGAAIAAGALLPAGSSGIGTGAADTWARASRETGSKDRSSRGRFDS